jgi:hypothetical protein
LLFRGVNFVECDRIRDSFSAYLERELDPSEERELDKHLASCPACQEDLRRFSRSLDRLHAAGEVEPPEGFLSDILEKIENRRIKNPSDKPPSKWFFMPPSFRLPIQAAAMVAIVFLSVYLTRMTPREELHPRVATGPKASVSLSQEKKDQVMVSKETERERGLQRGPEEETKPSESFRSKEVASSAPVLSEGKKGGRPGGQQVLAAKEEIAKDTELRPDISQQKPETKREMPATLAEMKKDQILVSKARDEIVKIDREVIVRTRNLEETFAQMNELVRQFGGVVSKKEGNEVLVSLPAASFQEFEQTIKGFTSSSGKSGARLPKERAGGVSALPGPVGFLSQEKSETGAGSGAEMEKRVIIRVLLLQD